MSAPQPAEAIAPQASPDGLRRIIEVHAQARAAGRGVLVVLHTPYGGGIEPLVKEWRRHLMAQREMLFEGNCHPGGTAYGALADVVARYARALDDMGLADDSVRSMTARVGASLGLPTHPGAEKGVRGELSVAGQLQFFEALSRLLSAMSIRLPAALLFHDLHLADSATGAALRFFIENTVTDPVGRFAPAGVRGQGFHGTVVVTTGDRSGSVDRLRTALEGRDNAHFISLRALEETQVREFLHRDTVVEQLMVASGGSVESLGELLTALPRRVEDIYLRRVEKLGRPEQRILEALAVLARPVKPDLLLRVAEVDDTAASLSALIEQRLIVRRATRGELLVDVPTPQNRALLHERIAEERRAVLHGRVGALLEERSRLGETVDIETLAHHYLRSNVDEKAVQYALVAAEQLHISFAYQQARQLLNDALPRIADPPTRAQVIERLVEVSSAMGEHDEALARANDLLEAAAVPRHASIHRRKGEIRIEMGQYAPALDDFAQARALLDAIGDEDGASEERVRILAAESEAYYGTGEYDRATEVAREGLDRTRHALASEGIRQAIRLTNTLGKVHFFRGDYEPAQHCFEENQRRAAEMGWPDEEVRAILNQGTVASQQRRYDDAERHFQAVLDFGNQSANPVTRGFCLLNLAVVHHKTLRYADALDTYLHGLATFKRSGNDLQFAVTAMNLGALYETLGDPDRARALLRVSIDVTSRRGIRYFHGRALYTFAMLEIAQENWQSAVDALAEAKQLLGATGSNTFADRIGIAFARAAHGQGNRTLRDELLSGVEAAGDTAEAREVHAERLLWEGWFALQDGDAAHAVEPMRRALVHFEQSELHERIWLARLFLALASGERGDARAARTFLESARDLIEKMALAVPAVLRPAFLGDRLRRRVVAAIAQLDAGQLPRVSGAVAPIAPRADARQAEAYRKWRGKYDFIVGEDARLIQIFRILDRVGQADSPVLIQGESGTGKELIAEAVHRHSPRRDGPFVKVNCAAFVETLLLSELFGHERGAFTGAMARKKGRFELAHGGTLLLDEIGDVSPNTQVALLRVLQERAFERVGGTDRVEVDVRLICATNRSLEEMVRQGTFRLDLYYRLKGVVVDLPALRDRRSDVPRLVEHFCRRHAKVGQQPKRFSPDALAFLYRYSWPGNIRELENFVRSMLLFVDGESIELANVRQFEDFFADGVFIDDAPGLADRIVAESERAGAGPETLELPAVGYRPGQGRGAEPAPGATSRTGLLPAEPDSLPPDGAGRPRLEGSTSEAEASIAEWALRSGVGLHDLKHRLETELIRRALEQAGGNITRAADLLDMKRPRLSQIVNERPELEALRAKLAGEKG